MILLGILIYLSISSDVWKALFQMALAFVRYAAKMTLDSHEIRKFQCFMTTGYGNIWVGTRFCEVEYSHNHDIC